MGDIHSELVGDELHIARTFVSTGDPNGVVTPGIIGEFYWDSTNNLLYVAESLLNTSWVTTTSAFDSFLELTDTPSSYSGQAGFVTQVNVTEDGLEFGQALRITDSPQFANLLLKPSSAVDVDFIIQDFLGAQKLDLQYNSTLDVIDIRSQVGLLLRSDVGGLSLSTGTLSVTITSFLEDVRISALNGNFFVNTDNIFVDGSTGFVGFGSNTPLAKIFVSSLLADTVPVSMQEALGTNGARIKTLIGTQNPEGNVTGDPGDHYWRVDGVSSDLFIKRSAGTSNTGWQSGIVVLSQFLDLTDTPNSYSGNNNFVVQVNQGGTGLVFGQALRPVDGPVFNGLELQQIANEDVDFLIIDSFPLTQFRIKLDDSENKIIIDSVLDLNITTSNGLEINAEGPASINVPNNALAINTNNADFSKNLNISGRLEVVNTIAPVLSSVLFDAGNIASGQSIFILGEYAYFVVADFDRLLILDVSDPTATPVIIGNLVDSVNMDSPRFIVVIATLAYIASANSNSLTIVDVSDSTNPFIVGQISDAVLLDTATSVYVVGKFAYLTAQTSDSLVIIDISDPKTPEIVGSLVDSVNLERAAEVVVLDKFAYVVSFASKSLSIIDISNSTNPTLTGVLIDVVNLNGASSLTVNGGFAYIAAAASDMLTIVDITDPSNPTLAGTLVDSVNLNGARGIAVAGKFAYIASAVGDSLTVIDISDPTNPVFVSVLFDSVNLPAARMPFISGKFAYVPAFNSLSIIDIHGIDASTANLGNIQSTNISTTRDAFIKGNLYAGALNVGDRGIHSDGDISNKGSLTTIPSQLNLLGSLTDAVNLNGSRELVIVNNYAYVVSSLGDSLTILDITEPTNPVIVGVLIDSVNLDNAFSISISGKYVYITSRDTDSINIIDVSNVSAPVLVGRLVDSVNMNSPLDNYVVGKYAYVTGITSDSLAVVDISDPMAPVLTGSLVDAVNFISPFKIYVLGKFAYVVNNVATLTIVDISDPTTPVIVGSITAGGVINVPSGIYVVGKYAYVTGITSDSFVIFDVSDPTSPTLTGSIIDSVLLDEPSDFSIDGNYAYVTTVGIPDSLVVIDISDRTNPIIIHSFSPGIGPLIYIQVSGKFGYVISFSNDTFAVIDIDGIKASTASIGNVLAGYLSVDNEAVIKGGLYAGGVNAGLHGVHSDGDISGLTSFSTFDKGDLIPISRLKNVGSNPGGSQRFIGNRDPNGNVIGFGGDVYFRGDEGKSGSYESRESVGAGTVWFKRSVNPPTIVEINTPAEFEALASGGLITVSSNLTIIFNITVPTTTRFVLDFANLNITGVGGITYTGAATLFSGSGNLRISGGINLNGDGTATLMAITGTLEFVSINRANISAFASLGSFTNGSFLLRFVIFFNCAGGFTLTNVIFISVFNVTGLAVNTPTAIPMATALFTVNTNNSLSIVSFNDVINTVTSTGSVFDFNTRIDLDVSIFSIIETAAKIHPSNANVPIFKQTTLATVPLNSVADASPATGTITAMADNLANGTTISSTTTYFEDEIVRISGTTSYNGTFQIFNVVAGVSFDINMTFVGNDATGSVDSERLDFILGAGPAISAGDSIKVTQSNFYNAFYTVLNSPVALTITVNGTFISTNTGTIEINLSLDETDVRIFAIGNVLSSPSIFLGAAFVNANTTPTTIAVTGTFQDLLFGTVGDALIASSTMAKWRMINELNGTFEFITNTVFNGWITFDFSVDSVGGVLDFRIKFQIDRGAGFVDLPDPIESLITVGSVGQNISKTFDLRANKGDLLKPQVVRDSGVSDITFRFNTINIRQ